MAGYNSWSGTISEVTASNHWQPPRNPENPLVLPWRAPFTLPATRGGRGHGVHRKARRPLSRSDWRTALRHVHSQSRRGAVLARDAGVRLEGGLGAPGPSVPREQNHLAHRSRNSRWGQCSAHQLHGRQHRQQRLSDRDETGTALPDVSNINWFQSGQISASNATPSASSVGDVTVLCGGTGATDFVIDVFGYYP